MDTNTKSAKQTKPKASRSWGVRDIANWRFDIQSFPEEWIEHLGEVPARFLMYVDGDGGHGKTEYIIKLSKMLAQYMGKVNLNNVEQGKHAQIKKSFERNRLDEIKAGKWMYGSIHSFDAYVKKLKRPNSGRIQIIDSISYWPLTTPQVQQLIESFPNKSFVFVAYKAHFNQNKPIAHLCDIKVRVEHFVATPSSRFGGNRNFVIWDRPLGDKIAVAVSQMGLGL